MPSASGQPPAPLLVNGRSYKLPVQPTVVVCIDGSEPDYIGLAIAAGCMPWLKSTLQSGTGLTARAVMPSFTNPNNLSIVTGVPPSIHGICGNYFFDTKTQTEVMMNDPSYLRSPTILAAMANAGKSVAVVTAKEKLRLLLGSRLNGICFSAEKADEAAIASHGIDKVPGMVGMPVPCAYSAALSEFVLAAGVQLMRHQRPDLMYLSTTDYVQHKAAPGTDAANRFYAMLDGYFAQLDALGCVVALTADHGMGSKIALDGKPNVVYLQGLFDDWLGLARTRVILPITDPYVAHHGALGSFATVYLPPKTSAKGWCETLLQVPGIARALPREQAALEFELPADRIGDVVVVSDANTVLGTTPDRHDLTQLDAPLRSHGGLSEQRVPLILNHPLPLLSRVRSFRNFDAFDLALNFAQ